MVNPGDKGKGVFVCYVNFRRTRLKTNWIVKQVNAGGPTTGGQMLPNQI